MSLIDALKRMAPNELKLTIDSSGPHAEATWKKGRAKKTELSNPHLRRLINTRSKEEQLLRLLKPKRRIRVVRRRQIITVGRKDFALERLSA